MKHPIDSIDLTKYIKRYSEVSFEGIKPYQNRDTYFKNSSPSKRSKFTLSLAMASATGILTSALPAGYNMGVINTPQEILKEFCNETLFRKGIELSDSQHELLWSFVVSLLLIGAIIGSGCAGWFADRLGRKRTIFLNICLGLISASMFPLSKKVKLVSVLMIGRFVAGIHCGIASSLIPIYLTEISPKSLKGAMGVLQVLGLCVGILIAQILGQKQLLGTSERWPYLLSLNSVFIALGLITLLFSPESPIFLYVLKGKEEKAVKVLKRMRDLSAAELEDDIAQMKLEQKLQQTNNCSFIKLFTTKQHRFPTFMVCALHMGQQLIGINAVFYYSTMTFERAGLTVEQSQYGSIGAAAVNALMSIIAVPLVNKFKRRVLLLISVSGATLCLILLCVSMSLQQISWMPFVTIAAFLCFVAIYGSGIGPIPYMIGSELFEQNARSTGMSLGCLTNWLMNFIIAMTFPLLQSHLNQYVFLIFSAIGIVLWLIIYYKMPETKIQNSQHNPKD